MNQNREIFFPTHRTVERERVLLLLRPTKTYCTTVRTYCSTYSSMSIPVKWICQLGKAGAFLPYNMSCTRSGIAFVTIF